MTNPTETLQALRVLFEAQVGADRTLLESFDAIAAPLKALLAQDTNHSIQGKQGNQPKADSLGRMMGCRH